MLFLSAFLFVTLVAVLLVVLFFFSFLFGLVLEELFGAGFPRLGFPIVTLTRGQSKTDHCQNKERMFHRDRWISDLFEKGNPSFTLKILP